MIIVKLMGGLGNQMFQYTAARSLSSSQRIYFDYSFLNNNNTSLEGFTARTFELNVFNNLKINGISSYLLRFLLSKNKKYALLKRLLPTKFKKVIYVNEENFKDTITKFNGHFSYYLDGYFQNPLHFESMRKSLLKEFSFPNTSFSFNELKNEIKQVNSVSIHIRRGDYLNPNVSDFHGILSLEYYQKAVSIINTKIINPVYFIFSDDPNWCKENLLFINEKIIVSGNQEAWIDMYLMTQCKHQIIANSSFSWWGAWLNQNPDKVVISPKKWFTSIETNIIPKEWISL
jgi:hypothetical protein